MATKKQKREAGRLRAEESLKHSKQLGLMAQKRDREARAKRQKEEVAEQSTPKKGRKSA